MRTAFVSSRAAAAPGESFAIALRQKIAMGWHTYWRNPGDSGAPTTIDWQLPAGIKASPIDWPIPKALPYGALVNYGYKGDTLLPLTIEVGRDAKPGPAVLKAHVSWLVCADVCVPQDADLTLTVNIAPAGTDDPAWAGKIAAARAALPEKAGLMSGLKREGEAYMLNASGPALAGARKPYFFPFEADKIDHAAPQPGAIENGAARLTLTPSVIGNIAKGPLAGLLTFETQKDGVWSRRAIEISTQANPP